MRAGDHQRQDTLAIGWGEDRTQSPGGSAWPTGQEEDGTGEGTAGEGDVSANQSEHHSRRDRGLNWVLWTRDLAARGRGHGGTAGETGLGLPQNSRPEQRASPALLPPAHCAEARQIGLLGARDRQWTWAFWGLAQGSLKYAAC